MSVRTAARNFDMLLAIATPSTSVPSFSRGWNDPDTVWRQQGVYSRLPASKWNLSPEIRMPMATICKERLQKFQHSPRNGKMIARRTDFSAGVLYFDEAIAQFMAAPAYLM